MNWRILIVLLILGGIIASLLLYPVWMGSSDKMLDEMERQFYLTNTTKTFNEQLKFREEAIKEYQNNYRAVYGDSSRNLSANGLRDKMEIRYLLPKTTTKFDVWLDNYTYDGSLFVGYDTLKMKYSIDEEKVNAIIEAQNIGPNEFDNVLKYQDYIKVEREAKYHIRVVGIVIFIGILVFFYFLLKFLFSVEEAKEDHLSTEVHISKLLRFIFKLSKGQADLDPKEWATQRDIALVRIENLRKELERLKEENTEYYVVEQLARKAESKMREVGNRSNLMLITGLIMAFIGVIVFYVTLPKDLGQTNEFWKIVTLSIRPTLILIFVEAVAWYLLKQHRSLLGDYKYYHAIYNKKLNYLTSYKLMQNDSKNKDASRNVLSLILLSEEIKNKQEKDKEETVVETSDGLLSSLIDKVLNKF